MSTPSDEQLKELEGLYQKRGQSDNDRILYEMDLRNKAPALLSTIQALRTELAAWRERGQGLREALDKVFWSAVMAEGEAGYLLGDIKQITQDALSQPPQSPWRPIETAPKDGALIALLVESDTEEWTPTQDAMEYVTIGSNSRDLNDIDEWTFAGWCWCNDHFTEGYGKPIKWAPLPQPPTKGEES
jgi:hypothetical protein